MPLPVSLKSSRLVKQTRVKLVLQEHICFFLTGELGEDFKSTSEGSRGQELAEELDPGKVHGTGGSNQFLH
jgi:hypothetical protein